MSESAISLTAFPKLDENKLHISWVKDWWDGPLNGLADYDDKFCWFEFHSMDEGGVQYFYLLYRLSPEQLKNVESWHIINEKWRLQWNEFHARQFFTPAARKFANDWKLNVPELIHPTESVPIGWFCSGGNPSLYGVQVTKPSAG